MFYLVRHSERLDEADRNAWREYALRQINDPNQLRKEHSILADPPVTPNGLQIAHHAGDSLTRLITEHHPTASSDTLKLRIYSSRLMRCLQTSICLARKLGLKEIYVSRGLALTAAAVERIADEFDFLSISEIIRITGGEFTIYECDETEVEHGIHPRDWYHALHDVSRHNPEIIKIVVAHRETIRNLLPTTPRLPYCAIALCHHTHSEEGALGRSSIERSSYFHIPVIYDCHGKEIHSFKKVDHK
mmetsp:Transcript_26423/g.28817  ORF Transcript_26423/g.28817 Transcript_26423/m.28817 type:complete len:246 (+) Transcript_26423:80-817(+)